MNLQLQQDPHRPGASGARTPADAAQPQIKDTIHSIQTKLDQLDNRTQVSPGPLRAGPPLWPPLAGGLVSRAQRLLLLQAHDQTLVSINNHLVNGKGAELHRGPEGAWLVSLKEEILRELERRVSLSCSSCQVLHPRPGPDPVPVLT